MSQSPEAPATKGKVNRMWNVFSISFGTVSQLNRSPYSAAQVAILLSSLDPAPATLLLTGHHPPQSSSPPPPGPGARIAPARSGSQRAAG